MATTTTNLGLTKPIGTEQALVSVINGNMDIIDMKVGAVPANKNVQGEIDSLSDHIANIGLYKTEPYTGTKSDSSYFATKTLPAGKYVYWGCGKAGEYGGYLRKSDGSAIGYVDETSTLTLTQQETIRVTPATSGTTWEQYYVCFLRIA